MTITEQGIRPLDVDSLLDAVAWAEHQEQLDEEFREWFQGSWFVDLNAAREADEVADHEDYLMAQRRTHCGTAMCIAGRVAYNQMRHDGYRIEYHPESFETKLYAPGDVGNSDWVEAVSEYLGITYGEGEELFEGDNSAADVRRIVDRIIANHR